MTWRALLVGTLGSIAVSIGAPYGSFKLVSASMARDFSVPAAVFMMFLLAVAVGLYRVVSRGGTLLTRGEMLVAFGMMAVACAICTSGLTAYFIPTLAAPIYYAK